VPSSNLPDTVDAYTELETQLDSLPVFDLEALSEHTLARLLGASTDEEALRDPTAMGLGEFADRVIVVHAITGALPSSFDTGPTRYIVLDVTDPETGERYSVSCGSPYVMAAAFNLARRGSLPATVRVLEKESANNPNKSSLWLVKA
jgi:hypothetical protein